MTNPNEYHLEEIYDHATLRPKRHPFGTYHFPSLGDAESYARWLTNAMDLPWCAIELKASERRTQHPVIASTRKREDFKPVSVSFNGVDLGPVDDDYYEQGQDTTFDTLLDLYGSDEEENPF